jgi:DNA-binding transcriptional MerR regulator
MKNNYSINENDMFCVKKFAKLVGTTPYTLRHYDEISIFQPSMRKNNYRYYSPTQITAFKMIRVLTEIGVPLDTIKTYADGGKTPESLMKLLSKQKDILTNKLNFIQESHLLISTQLELLNIGLSATENDVYVTELPETRIIMGDVNDFDGANSFYGEFTRFCNGEHNPKLNPAYPVGGYWESWDDFMHKASMPVTLPTRFFTLDPRGHQKIMEGLYLVAYTRGYYGKTNDLPERMAEYAKKNGLIFNGAVYHIYPFDELSISDPNDYLLQACAAVKETKRTPHRRTYNPK